MSLTQGWAGEKWGVSQMNQMPSTAGSKVTLESQANGESRFYYFITPWGTTRSFRTIRAARMFARAYKWVVVTR
jgi:hypothetical protein